MRRIFGFSAPPPRGSAILLVMVVLFGLTALAVPFVVSMMSAYRNARSRRLEVQATAAAEAALSYAAAVMQGRFDSPAGLRSYRDLRLAPPPLSPADDDSDNRLECFARVEDAQGRINLNTAGALVLANLLRPDADAYRKGAVIAAYAAGGRRGRRLFRSVFELRTAGSGSPRNAVMPYEMDRVEPLLTILSEPVGVVGLSGWGTTARLGGYSTSALRGGNKFVVTDPRGFAAGCRVRLRRGALVVGYGRVRSVAMRSNGSAVLSVSLPAGLGGAGGGKRSVAESRDQALWLEPEFPVPVNVNTASPEVLTACFAGLRLRSAGSAFTVSEAQARRLAAMAAKRIFRGPRDLRLMLDKAVRAGVVDGPQADAVYWNAVEPNCRKVRRPTVPFCYRSSGALSVEGTGVLYADGVRRTALRRLLRRFRLGRRRPDVFTLSSQEDFVLLDHAGLLRGMVTYPAPVEPVDPRGNLIPRRNPDVNRGTVGLTLGESGALGRGGEFFDHCDDFRQPYWRQEGYDISARGPFRLSGAPASGGGIPPGAVELWYRPTGTGDAVFFDQGAEEERNRITFFYQAGTGFVVRIFGPNLEKKAVEYHFPGRLSAAEWTHAAASWKSAWPGGQEVRVDGLLLPADGSATEFRPGSRLTAIDDSSVSVEDASDFPPAGALRIGDEVVEYDGVNGNTFTGVKRGARMTEALDHAPGTPVIPFGYVCRPAQDLPRGGATLVGDFSANPTCRVNKPPKPPKDKRGGIDDSETTIPVDDASRMPETGFILLGGEVCWYGSRSDTELSDVRRGQLGTTAVSHGHRSTIRAMTLEISEAGDYDPGRMVQIEVAADDATVEWIAYKEQLSYGGKHYLICNYSVHTRRWRDPKTRQVRTIRWASMGAFRSRYGTKATDHAAGAKVIPVVEMRGPQCGNYDSPVGPDGVSTVSVMDGNNGDVSWLKRAYYHQWASISPVRRMVRGRRRIVDYRFNGWHFEFFAALNDFVSRRYPRGTTRFLKFPSGLLPEAGGGTPRTIGASMRGGGRLAGLVDEVKVNVFAGVGGGKVALTRDGAGVGSGDNVILIEDPLNYPAPGGSTQRPPWRGSGLLRIDDEFMFFRSASTRTVEYLVDVFPTLDEKENRSWYNPLRRENIVQPNTRKKTVLVLSGVRRGVLGTEAVAHAPGAGVTFYDAAAITALSGGLSASGNTFSVLNAAGFSKEGFAWIEGRADGDTGENGEVVSWLKRSGNDFSGCRPFHGRYGTSPTDHPKDAIVRFQPTRYMDRYAQQYDGPGLAFLQAGQKVKGAVWDALEVRVKRPPNGAPPVNCAVRIFLRFDGWPAWDGAAVNRPGGLYQFDVPAGAGSAVFSLGGRRADSVEVRVFQRYKTGAFHPGSDWKREWRLDSVRFVHRSPFIVGRTDVLETQ